MRATLTRDGILVCGTLRLRATTGHGGVRADKREGDGATPVGTLPLRRVLFRADRVAGLRCAVLKAPLAPQDGWCDDPAHPDYNRLVRLPHEGRHETLWRDDPVYDVVGVLGWNDAPVRPGLGSAIFLHVARDDRAPTEGCIALERADLLSLLSAGLTEIEITL